MVSHEPHDCVVVGGGVHGTCIANYLFEAGEYAHGELRVVDPGPELLESFATRARQCGMRTLRSTFVHHIATDPFSLKRFATDRYRDDELVSTTDYPNRPTLDLFLDHARHVVDVSSIDDCHVRTTVRDVTDGPDHLHVQTDDGTLDARRVVLALGLGERPTRPEWATSLTDDAPIAHVWDDGFDPTAVTDFDGETYVVGGGITAAQLAIRLAESTDVTLLSRHELETATAEADPEWINWRHVEERIHALPAGSQARHDRIQVARNDATIPPYVEERLRAAAERDDLDAQIGEITCAHATDDGLLVRFADGTSAANVQVVLATGLDPVPNHPLVGRIADSLGLARGENGFPVLDDETLAWRRLDGTQTAVSVSGLLAQTSVGPLARNVVGARRVAERLLDAWPDTQCPRRTAARSTHLD